MKSEKHGSNTSVEITNVSQHGFWLFHFDREYFVPYEKFPWFRNASISQVMNVESTSTGKLYWPDLDIDLSIEILKNPENFRLVYKS